MSPPVQGPSLLWTLLMSLFQGLYFWNTKNKQKLTPYIYIGPTEAKVANMSMRGTWIMIGSACCLVCICGALVVGLMTIRRRRRRSHLTILSVEDSQHWQEHVERLFLQQVTERPVLGFDCEWTSRNGYVGHVALLQLCTASGFCVLVRLCKVDATQLPLAIKQILANDKILKVGVGCHQDAAKLLNDHDLFVRSYLDLGWLASRNGDSKHLQGFGLKTLAKHFLGIELEKVRTVQCSDWETPTLSEAQVNYAANDAWVAVQVFQKLSASSQTNVDEFSSWLDRPFKRTGGKAKVVAESPRSDRSYCKVIRKRPLYYNCLLQAPDGQQLCTCDVKKVQWYLDKERVSTEPSVIRLKFEPSRRPSPDEAFYLQQKDNQCVVCGSKDSYICKNVVPHEYRRHFPKIVKDHQSHDVVLLCVNCHRVSNLSDVVMRHHLAHKCNAPLGWPNSRTLEDPDARRAKSAAKALSRNADSIPPQRKRDLETVLALYFGVPEATANVIADGMNLDTATENAGYTCHGLAVVTYMSQSEGLLALERMWRKHFLDTMTPAFMPSMWSIDHGHGSLRRRVAESTPEYVLLFGTQLHNAL